MLKREAPWKTQGKLISSMIGWELRELRNLRLRVTKEAHRLEIKKSEKPSK